MNEKLSNKLTEEQFFSLLEREGIEVVERPRKLPMPTSLNYVGLGGKRIDRLLENRLVECAGICVNYFSYGTYLDSSPSPELRRRQLGEMYDVAFAKMYENNRLRGNKLLHVYFGLEAVVQRLDDKKIMSKVADSIRVLFMQLPDKLTYRSKSPSDKVRFTREVAGVAQEFLRLMTRPSSTK